MRSCREATSTCDGQSFYQRMGNLLLRLNGTTPLMPRVSTSSLELSYETIGDPVYRYWDVPLVCRETTSVKHGSNPISRHHTQPVLAADKRVHRCHYLYGGKAFSGRRSW